MFEEVKEMIDSTIYTNGRGEVTAQNINLAMHGMVDATEEKFGEVDDAVKAVEDKVAALEENGTGGSGALRVWLNDASFGVTATPEQVEENIATYNKLVEDKYASVILCYGADMGSISTYTSAPVVVQYAILQGETQMILSTSMAIEEGYPMECIAILPYADGTMEVFWWQDSTPASNGPLTFYVGYFTTLSAEERITVEQKEHNAKMFEIYKSSPYALGVLADQSEMFTASMGMSGRAIKTSVPCQAQYFPVETGAESIMLKQKITDNSEIGVIIFPDGSVYLANELE